jgi:hypothetical protein
MTILWRRLHGGPSLASCGPPIEQVVSLLFSWRDWQYKRNMIAGVIVLAGPERDCNAAATGHSRAAVAATRSFVR